MPTLTDLLRGGIVLGIFAVGALLVLISGGIDVSFTAVAAFTMYSTAMLLNAVAPWVPWWGAFLIAMAIGAGLGAINGLFIAGFGLPTLIVTLGTLSVFRGFMLTFIGQKQITTLPPGMREFGRMMVIRGDESRRVVLFAARGLSRDGGGRHPDLGDPAPHHAGPADLRHRRVGRKRAAHRDQRARDAVLRLCLCRACWRGWRGSSTPRWRGWRTRSTLWGWSFR